MLGGIINFSTVGFRSSVYCHAFVIFSESELFRAEYDDDDDEDKQEIDDVNVKPL